MKYRNRQEQTERAVYEALDEVCDEMNVSITSYPTVYRITRRTMFDDLFLGQRYEECFLESKRYKESRVLFEPKVVLIADDSDAHIYEEASHFAHLSVSGLIPHSKSKRDMISSMIIVEMFGLLCPMLLGINKHNPFRGTSDFFSMSPNERAEYVREFCDADYLDEGDFSDFIVHQQGYGLAERAFFAHHEGQFPKAEIRHLFMQNFSKRNSAYNTFLALREKLGWPIQPATAERVMY